MVTWLESEKIFREATKHLPEDQRFIEWKPSQNQAYSDWEGQQLMNYLLLFPTGEGKSTTSLGMIASRDYDHLVVVAPLRTHEAWKRDAKLLGFKVAVLTHEAFRQPKRSFPRDVPIIFDEFHKLGGVGAVGFKKARQIAQTHMAPIFALSATPNYNDGERCFCLEAVVGHDYTQYEKWLRDVAVVEPNRYGYYPNFVRFIDYNGAFQYLDAQPWCSYIEDTADWRKETLDLPTHVDELFERYGLDVANKRIMASMMEKGHRRTNMRFIDDATGKIRQEIQDAIFALRKTHSTHTKWLIFCSHKTVANALYGSAVNQEKLFLITGDTKEAVADEQKRAFIHATGVADLIGTSTLAEGVDGIDKVCQALLILDDLVGDDAKRRQLVGRILPRGRSDERERLVVTAKFEGDE